MINSLSEIWFDERKSIKKFSLLFLLPHSFALPVPFGFYDCCLRTFLRQQVLQSRTGEMGGRWKSLVSAELVTKNNISKNVFTSVIKLLFSPSESLIKMATKDMRLCLRLRNFPDWKSWTFDPHKVYKLLHKSDLTRFQLTLCRLVT